MGIFDNATKIMIGNKEVQSIKIGTSLLYEKASQESNILFEDACSSSSGLSNYRTPININQASNSGSPSLTYNSSNSCYTFTNSSSNDWMFYQIPELDGKGNFTLTAEVKIDNNSAPYVGIGTMPNASSLSSTYAEIMYSYYRRSSSTYTYGQRRRRGSSSNITSGNVSQKPNSWFKLEMMFDSSNGVTMTWRKLDGTSLKTTTSTVTVTSPSNRYYGIVFRCNNTSYKAYIRNIKAEKNS